MTSPNVPRNAYTHAPEQHPNLIIGSLQLLWWIFLRPSAFRNHLTRIDPDINTDSSLLKIWIKQKRWCNPALWRLSIQSYIVLPILVNILHGLVLWRLGESIEKIAVLITIGVLKSIAYGVIGGLAASLTFVGWFGFAYGIVVSLVVGISSDLFIPFTIGVGFQLAARVANLLKTVLDNVAFTVAAGVIVTLLGGVGGQNFKAVLQAGVAAVLGAIINLWLPVVVYPFLTIWNTVLYRLDKLRTNSKPSLLRWHSAFWDEWEFLPLRGLDNHLLLVLERNPDEGKAALNYLSTSRQRWAAQAVQIELDARELEHCKDVVAISNAHRTLAVDELKSPVTILLSGFSRISNDVDAALHQKSTYNQRLVLSRLAKELDSLIQGLTRSDEKYAVRFLPIATDWYRIITNYVLELTETVELRQEVDNPYILGVPLTEQQEIFTGRTDIGTRIEQLILDRRRPPLLLYGQRRMGKTSLLNNLGRLLPNSIIPMFVDLQGPVSSASDYTGFLYNIARAMIDSAKRQSAVTLPPLTRETLAVDPFTSFDEWLDKVEQTLAQNIALLSLDEFEALDDAISKGRFDEQDVLGMLRHLIQHRPRFKLLLAGSHTIEEFQRWASYLINVQVLHISYLKEPEARQLIERPVKDFTLRYEPDAVERVLQLTRCHPFLVQLLCAEIIYLKNEQDPSVRRLATLADVEAAVPAALSSGSFFFADIQNNQVGAGLADNSLSQNHNLSPKPAPTNALALLRFIAAQGEGATVSREVLSRQFADNLDSILELLLRRELIEEIAAGYRFQVELIRRWFT
ncbi:AAA family ATPase [Floridanema aerugineum]|uniref:AAA family ATPase n=1 Tax=Floridaenema aerugineum BLCC-F46 TaxID=3153654 RepID=A0ABV4X174_9CYAN